MATWTAEILTETMLFVSVKVEGDEPPTDKEVFTAASFTKNHIRSEVRDGRVVVLSTEVEF
jgi:hypothetical protein